MTNMPKDKCKWVININMQINRLTKEEIILFYCHSFESASRHNVQYPHDYFHNFKKMKSHFQNKKLKRKMWYKWKNKQF